MGANMSKTEFRKALEQLGLSQAQAAKLVGVDERTSRRYALREAAVPRYFALILRMMIKYKITPEEAEALMK
jgi:transcriptional regulator with XRE-family HTH domain